MSKTQGALCVDMPDPTLSGTASKSVALINEFVEKPARVVILHVEVLWANPTARNKQ